jgi:hypothetical protein
MILSGSSGRLQAIEAVTTYCPISEPLRSRALRRSYEEISPEWLTRVLADNHPGAKVVSHSLGEPDEWTSSRRRIFVDWNEAGKRADSLAACSGTERKDSRASICSA